MARDLRSPNGVRMFETVARELSFTRAAEQLHVTQGAVSRQIKLLEGEPGQALFHRRARRLELTDAGKQYRELVDDKLRMVRQGTARIRERGSSPRLSLCVLPSFAARLGEPRDVLKFKLFGDKPPWDES